MSPTSMRRDHAVDRRRALRLLAGAPALLVGGCCMRDYPIATPGAFGDRGLARLPIFGAGLATNGGPRFIDVHAHFFNASDVPVRGFVTDCLGHKVKSDELRKLIKYLGMIAEQVAKAAPTAIQELKELQALEAAARQDVTASARARRVNDYLERAKREAAEQVVDTTRGSRFLEQYRQMTRSAFVRQGPLTVDEVRAVVRHAGGTEPRDLLATGAEPDVNLAFGALEFLYYMLARRSVNLDAYRTAYTGWDVAWPIDTTLGALVDFDYWLDCPPYSAHEDQIALHALLSTLHGGYLRPLLAYNPWTDIALGGAGLQRVKTEWSRADSPYVGVKIYPPMGFYPAGNEANPIVTGKERPPRKDLDRVLGAFWDFCARERVPVMAHTGQSNGRDDAHDVLGGPTGWKALLSTWSAQANWPIVNFGHFGGATGNTWTQELAELMKAYPGAALYADLGYWEELMGTPQDVTDASARLEAALAVTIGSGSGTVADRLMFGTDWLMLSQQRRWRTYPEQVANALQTIAPGGWRNILGANALACFPRLG